MREYCDEFDVRGELRRDFFYLIRAMDAAYLKHAAERMKNGGKTS